jgi:putative hydrolase
MTPSAALRRIAYLLERTQAPTYRVKAFRGAAATVDGIEPDALSALAKAGNLRSLSGIGETTEAIIAAALAGDVPSYLADLEASAGELAVGGDRIFEATATATPTGPTGEAQSRRWPRRRGGWVTSTSC